MAFLLVLITNKLQRKGAVPLSPIWIEYFCLGVTSGDKHRVPNACMCLKGRIVYYALNFCPDKNMFPWTSKQETVVIRFEMEIRKAADK